MEAPLDAEPLLSVAHAQRDLKGIESYWLQQLAVKQDTVITAAEWKVALPRMFV